MLGARSYRKRPLFRAPSPTRDQQSPVSVASHVSRLSAGSGSSRRSRGQRKSLAASRKSYASVHTLEGLGIVQGKHLRVREWLLILIEIFISFAAWVISERNNNVEELIRVGLTGRQNAIYMLYWQGWAAFGSWFAGVLADSYIGHYNLALFSVALHFAVVSIVFMEDTIKGNQKGNPYAQLVWNITAISTLFLKSTDFTRVVFGLEGMGNRTKSTMLFIFLISWVNNNAYGGLIVNLSGQVPYPVYVKISFFTSGVCLYLYVYVLRPATKREPSDVSIKVVRCFLLACLGKFLRQTRKNRNWLDSTEGRCDKITIGKTKDMLKFYAVLFPTVGYSFIVMLRFDSFYLEYFKTIKSTGLFKILGIIEFTRVVVLLSSLFTYFCVWPLLIFSGLKRNLYHKFFMGYLAGVLAIYYASVSLRTVEFLQFEKSTGYVRIFNTRKASISVTPQDRSFSSHDYVISQMEASMVAYPTKKPKLFPVALHYHRTTVNFTVYLSVEPEKVTGYMILDPPDVVLINGQLPIMEGPPGTNIGSDPRLFLFSATNTLHNALLVVKKSNEKRLLREYRIRQGNITVFQLPPGEYDFIISEAEIYKTFVIKEGAIYGILSYSNLSSRSITGGFGLEEVTQNFVLTSAFYGMLLRDLSPLPLAIVIYYQCAYRLFMAPPITFQSVQGNLQYNINFSPLFACYPTTTQPH